MPLHAPSLQSMSNAKLPEPSTKNGRRSLKYVSDAGALGETADPARVEHAAARAVVAVHVEREIARAFDEERTALVEVRLECRCPGGNGRSGASRTCRCTRRRCSPCRTRNCPSLRRRTDGAR